MRGSASVGLGRLGGGGAPGADVPDGGRGAGRGGVPLPEHGVAGLGGAGEGARAVVQGGLVQGGRGQRLPGAALGGPGPVVPAVLPQAVRLRGAGGGAGAAGARGERGGAGGAGRRQPGARVLLAVLLHVVETLDRDRGGWRRELEVECLTELNKKNIKITFVRL